MRRQDKSSKAFVGMDVRTESIDSVVAERDGEVRACGRKGGDLMAVARAVRKPVACGKTLVFVYEAGPCGFGIHRWPKSRGHECWGAPSPTPKKPGERIKTDTRDATKLARLDRAGESTAIYGPEAADEALRDLVRTREDVVAMQRGHRPRWARAAAAELSPGRRSPLTSCASSTARTPSTTPRSRALAAAARSA